MTTSRNSTPEDCRQWLMLRLEAPLLSFGRVAVDERRYTDDLPGASMLTGLLANALGWHHQDSDKLNRLQQRLVYGVRQDRAGSQLEDFHTVDLGQDFLLQGWTSHGRFEGRGKGAATRGTHIRRRFYLADAAYTVALGLMPAHESPDLETLEQALQRPARPLFLGRKTCLPSRPLVGAKGEVDRIEASSALEALTLLPRWSRLSSRASTSEEPCRVWWPGSIDGAEPTSVPKGVRFDRSRPIYDERDWRHQFHTGRRFVNEGALESLPPQPAQAEQGAVNG